MRRLALPLIAIGVLAGCGGGESTDVADVADAPAGTSAVTTADSASNSPAATSPAEQPAATASTGAEQPANPPANVPEALNFSAPLVGGGDIELTTLAGRPVLLWFWAPW